ncbi:TetR/AcrR family transcriptional regulator [Amycolatopsis nigrescens]|uniref:TetR/AcrR family transcriptional regulator n=1 Tax=Amycolatopsis nigrescens TaxID=381445 RepID=UPI00047625D9|nr:TetR/AcrR family transcriptional regulator [Amycolatopsis nigrescens]
MSITSPPRRQARSRQAILRACLELCQEVGFGHTTMDGIARRAGVGKQTIYRWWPSKAAVVMEAINEQAENAISMPDSGDIVADLRSQMRSVVAFLAGDMAETVAGVIGAAQTDPALATALHEIAVEPHIARSHKRLEAARRQGQIRADTDLDAIVELLFSPLYFRLLLRAEPVSEAQVDATLDICFTGLRPEQPRPTNNA